MGTSLVIQPMTPPKWHSLSHHGRYRRLQKVRRVWCRYSHSRVLEDRTGITIHLDGTWITDIPSFYLSLGEAIHGPNGYFGACLDALDDCLCGRFGILPPLTIRLSHFDDVRKALDGRAWCRFHAEVFDATESEELLVQNGFLGDGSEADIAYWTALYEAALAGEPFEADDIRPYFDVLREILASRGVEMVTDVAG